MFFALLHELGHLFVGLFLGFTLESLSINPLGLSINFSVKLDDYNKRVKNGNVLALKRLVIASSGPAVNFILAILFLLFDVELLDIKKEFLIYSNLLIGLFNLIPIYPLDGGRIIKNILHIIIGLEDTYSYINFISNASIIILTAFSSIIIFYLKNVSILFIVVYLWCLVIRENKLYGERAKIYKVINDANAKMYDNEFAENLGVDEN
ncbi:MAG: site-2 protease family protein [Clostridia bacterium]|nr:site-2 protease family protein [Clostridia bacterium]